MFETARDIFHVDKITLILRIQGHVIGVANMTMRHIPASYICILFNATESEYNNTIDRCQSNVSYGKNPIVKVEG
jgi:hypothetical protein